MHTLHFCFIVAFIASKYNLFENIFDFTTAGDRNCVAAADSFPYSLYFLVLWNHGGPLMRPKWLMVASLVQKICTLYTFVSLLHSLLPNITFLRTYLTSLQLVTGTVWRQQTASLIVYIFLSFGIMEGH